MKIYDFEDWELTQYTLKDVLDYDPETGNFIWLVKPSARVALGQRAGSLDAKGYRVIKIAGQSYKAHRLAWLWEHGEWPKLDLDFINRDPDDCRIKNLREATKSQNGGNSVVRRKGLKGAYWHEPDQKWTSAIRANGKNYWLGNFKTEKEAHAAYCQAAKKYFGRFAHSGK
jgi:hypothetical protein